MAEFTDLFTVPLFEKVLNLDNDEILSYCHSLEKQDPGRIISNMGGYQSNDIFNPPEQLEELFSSIVDFSLEICNEIEIYPVRMHNAWVNINRYKDSNWPHTHPDAILSGVYYVKTPEDCGDIEFENPASDGMNPQLRSLNGNNYTTPNWRMPCEENTLYIFPGWLRHGVNSNFNKTEERVSISFNLIH